MIEGILIKAGDVPEGQEVSKRTGEKLYTIAKTVRIFGDGAKREIKASDNVCFLVNGADINCIAKDDLVMWRPTSLEFVRDWIDYTLDPEAGK